jgi:hypothetical protein
MQSCLGILKTIPTEESYDYKLFLGLQEITLAGLLSKYERDMAYRNCGKAGWWEKSSLLAI